MALVSVDVGMVRGVVAHPLPPLHPFWVFISIVLAIRRDVRVLALPLDLGQLSVTQTLVAVLRARRAERPLAIASRLPLATSPAAIGDTQQQSARARGKSQLSISTINSPVRNQLVPSPSCT
jgi:hypothetical protein